MVVVGHKNAIGPNYFEREEILQFVKDRPQVLADIPADKFIYFKELKKALREYNKWYKEYGEAESSK